MGLIERLKQTYESGAKKGFLNMKRFAYCFMFVKIPDYLPHPDKFRGDLLDEIRQIDLEEGTIPKPKGFLEELAYNLGANPREFWSPLYSE